MDAANVRLTDAGDRSMLRRRALSLLLGTLAPVRARAAGNLDRFLGTTKGVALLLDIRTRRPIAISGADLAGRSLAPPGSALKPFVLAALLKSGKLDADAAFPCPARLTIRDRTLDCSHPPLATPVRIDTALAYSCNCFVAHAAERFEPGELARALVSFGLDSPTGLIPGGDARGRVLPARDVDAQRLQALGEDGILITAAELAFAYRLLALQTTRPELRPIFAGLEGAVEFGTAQHARVSGVKVAGKTGSVLTAAGEPLAWFAGFLPSRAPEVVIVVMLPGRSGGADAAPVAGRILEAFRAGRI
jgi:cell division protein FtsI/penicillin-binding protein 2